MRLRNDTACYLQEDPAAFHVFIYAPFEEKVRRIEARGYSEKEANLLAETVDRDRSAYIRKYFDVEWPHARYFYHLMINSAIGDDLAPDGIIDLIARRNAMDRS